MATSIAGTVKSSPAKSQRLPNKTRAGIVAHTDLLDGDSQYQPYVSPQRLLIVL